MQAARSPSRDPVIGQAAPSRSQLASASCAIGATCFLGPDFTQLLPLGHEFASGMSNIPGEATVVNTIDVLRALSAIVTVLWTVMLTCWNS